MIDIAIRINILRPGIPYWREGSPQTEADYGSMVTWTDPNTIKPTWAEITAMGDVEAAEKVSSAREQMVVSRFQARAALHNAGLLVAVSAIMQDQTTDPLIVMAWEDIPTFRRLSPAVQAIGAAIGLDDESLDDLFRAAALIEV